MRCLSAKAEAGRGDEVCVTSS